MKKLIPSLLFALTLHTSNSALGMVFCQNVSGKTIYTEDAKQCVDTTDAGSTPFPTDASEKSNYSREIPSLIQTKKDAGFAGSGLTFCGPVAVSNSLAWIEKNTSEDYQIALVKKLSSGNYMNTNLQTGTSVGNLLHGVHKYAMEHWGHYGKLEYSGWSSTPNGYHSNLLKPTLPWLLGGLHTNAAVWLNIGWYKINNGNYERIGGHWVTLVGYESGNLVVHDPWLGDLNGKRSELISMKALEDGKLIEGKYSTNAKNHFLLSRVGKNWTIPAAVLDGAVLFEL